jgi:Na+/proline symporter
MLDIWTVSLLLVAVAALIAVAGVIYSRGRPISLEDYISSRGTLGSMMAAVTLVASGMGAWILFGPAEAATWGGILAVAGYSLGAAAPFLALIVLGRRLRRLIPQGHTLTEFVWHRYGRGMYAFTLLVMVFYMFIFLVAEVTGMALLVSLVADVPLWVTALIVMVATLAYTAYGGLRASIFTDSIQSLLILPFLVLLVVLGAVALGGIEPISDGLAERAPHLVQWDYRPGWEGGLTFVIAVLVANLFHQGYWQRVFAMRDERALRTGFLVAAIVVVPIVFLMGLFGLAAVGLDRAETPSVALFSVLMEAVPDWFLLGLALVMSSADSILNGLASIIAVDLRRVAPRTDAGFLLRASRWATVVLAVPIVLLASQGYSVLYLFLLADLVCAAAAFPVFFGLYSDRYSGRVAIWSVVAGLIAGGLLFPDPDMTRGNLLASFLVAGIVPVLVSLVLMPRRATFDLRTLARSVQPIRD